MSAAVILAGGLGRRLGGGGDKPFLALAGKPLLAHVIERLRPQVAALALNGGDERLRAFGLPVLPDPLPGFLGPLAGLLAAMEWAAGQGFADVLTVPADAPFLPGDLAARLRAERGGAEIAVAESAGRRHPVVALWPTHLAVGLRIAMINQSQRRMGEWQGRHRVAAVAWDGDPFLNVNTPDDLAVAERALGG